MKVTDWHKEIAACPNGDKCTCIQGGLDKQPIENGGISVRIECQVCHRQWQAIYPEDWRASFPTYPDIIELKAA